MICVDRFWPSSTTSLSPQTTKTPNSISKLLRSSKSHNNGVISVVKTLPLPLSSSSSHEKIITSPSNPFVKHCIKLRQSSSYRHSHSSVLVLGSTPIREIHKFQEETNDKSTNIDCLLVLENEDIPEELNQINQVIRVSSIVMKKLSGVQSIDSINMIALMKTPKTFHNLNDHVQELHNLNYFPHPHRILILDGIQDPGNLGTLLRSALAFRWDGAYLLPGCCDPFNEKALRASRGAVFRLPIVLGNWKYLEGFVNEFKIKMLAGHPGNNGKSTGLNREFVDSLVDESLCLVLGSEGSGISEKTKDVCELVSIPMEGGFESLNVSIAGGIFLYMLQPLND